jgi:hypothetical protein
MSKMNDEDVSSSFEVKENHGLFLQYHSEDGSVSLTSIPDRRYDYIHPNCYAPATMDHVRLLYGGGSGTAVFGGLYYPSPQVQQQEQQQVQEPINNQSAIPIVMKHGGPKDTNEVFSLATITAELLQRRSLSDDSEMAYQDMKCKIPEFIGVYISPHHLRDRGKELWCSLRSLRYTPSGTRLSILGSTNRNVPTGSSSLGKSSANRNRKQSSFDSVKFDMAEPPTPRTLRVQYDKEHSPIYWDIRPNDVTIHAPTLQSQLQRQRQRDHDNQNNNSNDNNDGTTFIRLFGDELKKQEQKHEWKVTLMQKWIGGPDAINGADILTSGNLTGDVLDTLIREFTDVMNDLYNLTSPQERCCQFNTVRIEVEELQRTQNIRFLSKAVDRYVGRSILKNFHPDHGRFRNLRVIGEDIQEDILILTDAEQVPATFLGRLLEPNVSMQDIFIDPPSPLMALDVVEGTGWFPILQEAMNFQNKASFHVATDCLWTCGLTDAGLHNCFLSVERGLEMFDLGEPSLEPRPAFLTKFLMSFFHTLGMEVDGSTGIWKNRFAIIRTSDDDTERLSITSETKDKLPYLVNVFNITVDHIIKNVFHGDESVRKLMLTYVVLQLLSDASFCLQRWEAKGGGAERCGERSKEPLEKWLWRTIWDCYIASYVQEKLLKPIETSS